MIITGSGFVVYHMEGKWDDHDRAEKSLVVKKLVNKPVNKTNPEEITTLYNTGLKPETKQPGGG